MKRELVTYPMDHDRLRREFRFVVNHMRAIGQESCRILFGYAWGNDYYPGERWDYETVATGDVVAKVEEVEARGCGILGSNDLFLEFPAWEFRFCNDSDIHMSFSEETPIVEFFHSRWTQEGFRPAIWPVKEFPPSQPESQGDTPAGPPDPKPPGTVHD